MTLETTMRGRGEDLNRPRPISPFDRPLVSKPALRLVRPVVVFAFVAAFIAVVAYSWRWPLMWDSQVIHYVSFLMDRGLAPYRQIGDMNMPGAYIMEHAALRLFGNGDVGWRLWDFTLCGSMTLAMIAIARRTDWVAGLVAGGIFTLFHGRDGPYHTGQRDEVMAVLLVIGCACLIESVRQRRAWLMAPFGLATGMAAAVKPTLMLGFPVLLLLAWLELRRREIPSRRYLAWSVAGGSTATAIVLGFLLVHGSFDAFIQILTTIVPHYAGLDKTHHAPVWVNTLPYPLYFYLGLAMLAAFFSRGRQSWEQGAVLAGIALGLLSYFGQLKGYNQHRYPEAAFILLWASMRIFQALRGKIWAQVPAMAALLFAVAWYAPQSIKKIRAFPPYDNFSRYLESDLKTIGTPRLERQVECLDIVDGCLTALFHLQVQQMTGATGDLLLFVRDPRPPVAGARAGYWSAISKAGLPAVFVLSNWHFGEDRDFHLVDTWPDFSRLLADDYVMVDQREFFPGRPPTSVPGSNPSYPAYRIYIRKDSPLMDAAPALRASEQSRLPE